MKIITSASALHAELEKTLRADRGFVPTMGALHQGHRSLVDRARAENKTLIVSVFVNPTQFNDPSDLSRYPRTLEADARMLEQAGVDILFAPSVGEVYPVPDTRVFDLGKVATVMEGASRPGHFNGVAQVVSRLFELVDPARAYFGEKDFQQIAVIRRMVALLGSDVQIVPCPIVRGSDGLALSSRNALLNPEARAAAPHIFATLHRAVELSHQMQPTELQAWVRTEIDRVAPLRALYFEAVDASTMQPVLDWRGEVQGCVAVQAGDVRLIDNIKLR